MHDDFMHKLSTLPKARQTYSNLEECPSIKHSPNLMPISGISYPGVSSFPALHLLIKFHKPVIIGFSVITHRHYIDQIKWSLLPSLPSASKCGCRVLIGCKETCQFLQCFGEGDLSQRKTHPSALGRSFSRHEPGLAYRFQCEISFCPKKPSPHFTSHNHIKWKKAVPCHPDTIWAMLMAPASHVGENTFGNLSSLWMASAPAAILLDLLDILILFDLWVW